ncbi:hypothetical protein CONCODRAFT_14847 [Conidiobolus coronatus NRRL 28638]|uniref:Uncharacterized protein n=1 Tax=Conidiobolus coronatus (strain ATCC 28846 / CBS 209.66 / NRRL 28638) TaxID=796925 RepID=A0A137PHB1_CONC2|nr:hypothetical protein CONCODRAFT_14847 [Conidiobolus coronatus NRRL 28638]|eukprot:KXN74355.1 hypothetical protein CONCODRAFT_14847 [Conidiobolus coronatus NRRL 28638]
MYLEAIKYVSFDSDENTHFNKIRNVYFENRSCLINVLDFLDQEVVIIPGSSFSYDGGINHIMEDHHILSEIIKDETRWNLFYDSFLRVEEENGYHLSIIENYLTIVADNRRCIFTNRDMEEGTIIGTILWVKNFNELLENYSDRNLKRISKAIVCPLITKLANWKEEKEYLDDDFILSMDIYYPEVSFKYTIDTYMSNVCIDVYNKLLKRGLNGLVDKYIPSYKQCNGYGKKGEDGDYSTKLCKCGGLRVFCYLDM